MIHVDASLRLIKVLKIRQYEINSLYYFPMCLKVVAV